MKALPYFIVIALLLFHTSLTGQKIFTSPEELMQYAKTKSISVQSGAIKITQAQKARLAAIANIIDPTINTTSSFTNNTQLPINLFPAEVFGGQPGTFREVQAGIQYVTNLNQYADIKLLNLGAWENLQLAKINIATTESDNQITLKSLYDNIASAYYNIVSLQEQLVSTYLNLNSAETLLRIAQNKYEQGLVKQQDVNDTKASFLSTQENARQLDYLVKQNKLTLKILCDIPEEEMVEIRHNVADETISDMPRIEVNNLNWNNSLWKEKYALSNYKQYKKGQLPILSFVASNTFQQNNTQFKVVDKNTNWITSNYLGLKLSFNLPSAKSVSQIYHARYEYQLAQKNTERSKIKSALEYQQLGTDWDKAVSQAGANKKIYELRKDSYSKNRQLYEEGLIGIDQVINSYHAMVNANYSLISSQISIQLAQSKIDINNKIKQ
jgi:outer membrane protein TolC